MYFDKWVGLMLTIGVAGITAILLLGCEDEAVTRARSLQAAKDWIQENRLDATASCRYPNPNACDVIPKDPRPNILLICGTTCRVAIQ